jgi:hypothetical protein
VVGQGPAEHVPLQARARKFYREAAIKGIIAGGDLRGWIPRVQVRSRELRVKPLEDART